MGVIGAPMRSNNSKIAMANRVPHILPFALYLPDPFAHWSKFYMEISRHLTL